jgi:hypothetical protein
MAKQILAFGSLSFAGRQLRVAKYLNISPQTQCTSCQSFGHVADKCTVKICQLCSATHLTKDHTCKTCKVSGKTCPHTSLCCINCKGNHAADSKACPTYLALSARRNPQAPSATSSQSRASPGQTRASPSQTTTSSFQTKIGQTRASSSNPPSPPRASPATEAPFQDAHETPC